MPAVPATWLSPEEYLKREPKAERRSEYFHGEVFAMPGNSLRHVQIVTRLIAELGLQLRDRPCYVYSTELRLHVNAGPFYTYPDVMVVRGEPIVADEQHDTLTNPTVIIEVLSDSTRDYDRGRKFQYYRTLPSLIEYLTVDQDAVHVEQWTRQTDQRWVLSEADDLGTKISLASIGVELALADVYDKIVF